MLNASSVGTITGAPPPLDRGPRDPCARPPWRTRCRGPTRSPTRPASAPISSTNAPCRPATRAPRPRLLRRPRDLVARDERAHGSHSRTSAGVPRPRPHRADSTRRRRHCPAESSGNGSNQLPCDERDVAGHAAEAGAVGLRDGERVGRYIGGPHLGAGPFERDRQGDRARSGAEIDDHALLAPRVPPPIDRARPVRARSRPRFRDAGSARVVEIEIEAPERPTTHHVLQRLAREAAFEHAVEGNHLRAW